MSNKPRVYKLSEMGVPEINSTEALQAALDQIAMTGGTLIWDQPVKLTGQRGVQYTSGKDLTVEFVGPGLIDATELEGSLASREAILFSGYWGGMNVYAENLPEGSRYIKLTQNQARMFSPDDAQCIVIAANNGRFHIRSGEIIPVTNLEIIDNVVNARLAHRTRDSHVIGDDKQITIWLIRTPKIVVRGMKLFRNPEPQKESDVTSRLGLYLRYVRDFVIEDCHIYGCKYQSFLVLYGHNGYIRNCSVDTGPGGAHPDSLSYGFAVGPANNVILENCRVQRCRCAFSTVGNQASYGIVARNCLFDSSDEPIIYHAFRNHASTNDMTFENCVVKPGLSSVARNIFVRNCIIDGDVGRAICGFTVTPQINHVQQVVIEDSVIQGGYAAGIYISGMTPEVTFDLVRIKGCHLDFGRSNGFRGIRISPSYGHVNIKHLAMLDNYVVYPVNWPLEISSTGSKRLRINQLTVSGYWNKTAEGGSLANLEIDGLAKVTDTSCWVHAGRVVQSPFAVYNTNYL